MRFSAFDSVSGNWMRFSAYDSVVVDVLSLLGPSKAHTFTLEICALLLPLLEGLLSSPHERYVSTGLSVVASLLASFGDVIQSTRAAKVSPFVDIQAEQRRERCTACSQGFQAVAKQLAELVRKGGTSASRAKELYNAIEKL
eukprot:TRINITY_DN5825_c0_g1_i2.p1 TRINITY_DN5825_c0_g1~~TRINITY_DN5825_c0_g1_i2.p1  ORF type:complete len:142 (-),score=32.06 TRINITY_DN5825_c0_g1_i2:888-1313(-)